MAVEISSQSISTKVWDPAWTPTSLFTCINGYELVQIGFMVIIHVHIIDYAYWQPCIYIM